MKKKTIVLFTVLALAACGTGRAETCAKRVLFVGSDGMSAAVLRRSDVKAPTLRGLMARGAWSLKARTIVRTLAQRSRTYWACVRHAFGLAA